MLLQIIVDVLAVFGAISLLGFALMWFVILHTEDPAYRLSRRMLDQSIADAQKWQSQVDEIEKLDRWENWTR